MIVAPNFLDHWKTKMLQVELGGDLLAPTYVLRLWGHCQLQKTHKFHRLSASALAAICGFMGEPGAFWLAIQNSGFVEVDNETVIARHWDEYNASLLTAWANGAKGGRPAHNPPDTQRVPTGGTFALTSGTATTAPLAFDSPPKTIERAIAGRSAVPRARDLIFEALAQVECSDVARLTKSGRGKLNKATAEIRAAEPGVTADRVKLAAKNWAKKYPTTPATCTALAGHWGKLTPAPETKEETEQQARRRADRAAARQRIKELTTEDGPVPMPRDDLTESELQELRELRQRVG